MSAVDIKNLVVLAKAVAKNAGYPGVADVSCKIASDACV